MAYPKQKPEYFLQKIKEFHSKNNRAPRSDEFNGPFHKNVMTYFGSWAAAVRQATGVELNCARKTDEQLLQPIRDYYSQHKQIIPHTVLKCGQTLVNRFGSVQNAVIKAIGVDVELLFLKSIAEMCVNGVDCVTGVEIQDALKPILNFTNKQLSGTLTQIINKGLIVRHRGDRIALYSLTRDGIILLKHNTGASDGNRVR